MQNPEFRRQEDFAIYYITIDYQLFLGVNLCQNSALPSNDERRVTSDEPGLPTLVVLRNIASMIETSRVGCDTSHHQCVVSQSDITIGLALPKPKSTVATFVFRLPGLHVTNGSTFDNVWLVDGNRRDRQDREKDK